MPRVAAEPTQPYTCPGCGHTRTITISTLSRIRKGTRTGLCRDCLYPQRITVTQRHRNYWLHPACEQDGRPIHGGFTLAEIRELAAGLDTLLNDHSGYAHDRPRKEARNAA